MKVVLVRVPEEIAERIAAQYQSSPFEFVSSDTPPETADVAMVWVPDETRWRDVLRWAASVADARKIALVPREVELDEFTAAAAREAGLEAWVPLLPADLPQLLAPERHYWVPGAPVGSEVVERIVERVVERQVVTNVPTPEHPRVIAVTAVVPGAGATTVAATIAGYTARLPGYRTALVDMAQPRGALRLAGGGQETGKPGAWVPPGVDLVEDAEAGEVREIVGRRRYHYVVIDAGAVTVGRERRDEFGELYREGRWLGEPSVWPEVCAVAGTVVVVLPGQTHRVAHLAAFLRGLPADQDFAGVAWLKSGGRIEDRPWWAAAGEAFRARPLPTGRGPLREAEDGERYLCPPVYQLPDVGAHDWPPGYRDPDARIDRCVEALLGLQPLERPKRRKLLGVF